VGPIRNREGYRSTVFEPCQTVVGCPISTVSPSMSSRCWSFISRIPKAEFVWSSMSCAIGFVETGPLSAIDSHYRQYSVASVGVPEWFAMSPIPSMPEDVSGEGNEVGKGENTG
jgi:hypothetical protein